MKKGKVVLVGTGFVGMSMAYSMLNRGGVNELVLIDIDKDKTVGEQMDLSHGLPFAPQKMVIKAGDYNECKDAQVVVITAGIAQRPGQTRLELAETNTRIMKIIDLYCFLLLKKVFEYLTLQLEYEQDFLIVRIIIYIIKNACHKKKLLILCLFYKRTTNIIYVN